MERLPNFDVALHELENMPAIVNFCRREQGLLIQKSNPKNINGIADLAQPGIRPVASVLDLDFIPFRWERYDLLIRKERFFDKGVQLLLGLLHEKAFYDIAAAYQGYDLSLSGKMVYPQE
jgi:molybdate-binding protein